MTKKINTKHLKKIKSNKAAEGLRNKTDYQHVRLHPTGESSDSYSIGNSTQNNFELTKNTFAEHHQAEASCLLMLRIEHRPKSISSRTICEYVVAKLREAPFGDSLSKVTLLSGSRQQLLDQLFAESSAPADLGPTEDGARHIRIEQRIKPAESRFPTLPRREFSLQQLSKTTFLQKFERSRVSPRGSRITRQILDAVGEVRAKGPSATGYPVQFVRMFKMQMELTDRDFAGLGLKLQVHFLCYFFHNFMDRKLAMRFYGDLGCGPARHTRASKISSKWAANLRHKKHFACGNGVYEYPKAGPGLADAARRDELLDSVCTEEDSRAVLLRIKAMLVYTVMLLDTFKLFLKVKLEQNAHCGIPVSHRIDAGVTRANERILREKLKKRGKERMFQADLSLCERSIPELVRMVSVGELLLFVRVTQLSFRVLDRKLSRSNRKHGAKSKAISLDLSLASNGALDNWKPLAARPKGARGGVAGLLQKRKGSGRLSKLHSRNADKPVVHSDEETAGHSGRRKCSKRWTTMEVFEFELEDIVLAKSKRRDEIQKFIISLTCKGILERFRPEGRAGRLSSKQRKASFRREVLESNTAFIEAFRTKHRQESIIVLKECARFRKLMNRFVDTRFVARAVQKNILDKEEWFMHEELSFAQLVDTLPKGKKKTGWTIQSIVNSIEVLDNVSLESVQKGMRKVQAALGRIKGNRQAGMSAGQVSGEEILGGHND